MRFPVLRSFRQRMLLQISLMVVATAAMAIIAAIGISGLHQDVGVAVAGYHQLRQVYEVGNTLSRAHDLLAVGPFGSEKAAAAIEHAMGQLSQGIHDTDVASLRWFDDEPRQQCIVDLRAAAEILRRKPDDESRAQALARLNATFSRLLRTSADIRTRIAAQQEIADHRKARTLSLVIATGIIAAMLTGMVGWWLYRGTTKPLNQLSAAVRAYAGGTLDGRLPAAGDREFAALAHDLNLMAAQLQSLVQNLEREVEARSRELLQSERLASIGYLAAGVAHEINNPLAIIAGYAQRIERQMGEGGPPPEEIRQTLEVISQEAFRCKQITDRLLSLARPGTDTKQSIDVLALVREVVATLDGLPRKGNRTIHFQASPSGGFHVKGAPGELKQVAINLLVNALDAVSPEKGTVWVELTRRGDGVEILVRDDGRGMTPQTLERVFEPFFSEKSGQSNATGGTGLGLSISHAIVQAHGGRVWATSDGPGKGSCFVVRLPAIADEVHL